MPCSTSNACPLTLLPMSEVLVCSQAAEDLDSCQPQLQNQPNACGQFFSPGVLLAGGRVPAGKFHKTQGDTAWRVLLPALPPGNGMLEAVGLCGHFRELTYHLRSAPVPFGEELVFP